ncbi:ATP synthase protein I [Hyphomicrobium sp. 1Nfss2.1]|uniref:AtpZ/AtpI family protein n=1 Tax=Hyphomicrobium sp. 1Nfss2.1 TaxID=3413936 RepID=UPI003C79A1F2
MSSAGNNDAPGHGELSPQEREAFRQRSEAIGKRLDAVKTRREPAERSAAGAVNGAAFAKAFRFGAELLVGVGVGGFIGWAIDRQLGTGPWLLVLFVMLGFAAGVTNVIRSAQEEQRKQQAAQLASPSVKDDDDEDDR